MGNAGHLRILLGHTFHRIDDQDCNIAAVNRRNRTDNAETLEIFFDLALTAQPCRIDEDIFMSVDLHLGIDRITRGTCDIGNDHAVLTCDPVDDRGLADIRLTDDSDLRNGVIFFILFDFWEMRADSVEHVAQAQLGNRRDRIGLAES